MYALRRARCGTANRQSYLATIQQLYLNAFDQFVKRDIKCRHYGRYVDDSVQIDPDRDWLIQQVPREREFLADELGLQLHMGKLHIQEIHSGIEFLGTFIKPYRDYVSHKTLERMTMKIQEIDLRNEEKAVRSMSSYIGILSHTASHNIVTHLKCEVNPQPTFSRLEKRNYVFV